MLQCDSICLERFWRDSVCAVVIRTEGSTVEMAIGYFGDARLEKNGALIAQRVSERQAVCVRKLADDRSEQVKFPRFLANAASTPAEIVPHQASLARAPPTR